VAEAAVPVETVTEPVAEVVEVAEVAASEEE
jgi:hypothetical protein